MTSLLFAEDTHKVFQCMLYIVFLCNTRRCLYLLIS
jgi:hypothetical protein